MTERTLAQVHADIEALHAEKWALEHPIVEYPKHVQIGEVSIVVQSAEHEKAVLGIPTSGAETAEFGEGGIE